MRNDNPEKDPVLSEAETIGRHRLFILDGALGKLAYLAQAAEAARTVESTPVTTPKYPHNVVRMDLRSQETQQTEQEERLNASRDIIDEIYGGEDAA